MLSSHGAGSGPPPSRSSTHQPWAARRPCPLIHVHAPRDHVDARAAARQPGTTPVDQGLTITVTPLPDFLTGLIFTGSVTRKFPPAVPLPVGNLFRNSPSTGLPATLVTMPARTRKASFF